MIVCVCNRLSTKDIHDAACSGRCRTLGEVYRCLECRVQCGKCVPEVRQIFQHSRGEGAEPRSRPPEQDEASPADPEASES